MNTTRNKVFRSAEALEKAGQEFPLQQRSQTLDYFIRITRMYVSTNC